MYLSFPFAQGIWWCQNSALISLMGLSNSTIVVSQSKIKDSVGSCFLKRICPALSPFIKETSFLTDMGLYCPMVSNSHSWVVFLFSRIDLVSFFSHSSLGPKQILLIRWIEFVSSWFMIPATKDIYIVINIMKKQI